MPDPVSEKAMKAAREALDARKVRSAIPPRNLRAALEAALPILHREWAEQLWREVEPLFDALTVKLMERDWLIGAWAASQEIPQAEAEAEMLAWTKKWRESASDRPDPTLVEVRAKLDPEQSDA